ncbi:MAG: hypothetical protein PUF50_04025 [Erysipelotrichaceae bacterium]|nr:hypothetical protein [Erysipelotrichaceae bacterium]
MNTVIEWNEAYAPIWKLSQELIEQLKNKEYVCRMDYQTRLSVKDEAGNQVTEYFPVPVIRVNEQLDVAIHPFGAMLTVVMSKETALRFRFQSLLPRYFEIHGMADPSLIFYQPNLSLDDIRNLIANSDEQEIGITFTLPLNEDVSDMIGLIEFAFHA